VYGGAVNVSWTSTLASSIAAGVSGATGASSSGGGDGVLVPVSWLSGVTQHVSATAPASASPTGRTTWFVVNMTGLSLSGTRLGASYRLHAECVWVATGERVRLPPRSLSVVSASLVWPAVPQPLVVAAYEPQWLAVTVQSPGLAGAVAASASPQYGGGSRVVAVGVCGVAVVNASAASVSLSPDAAAAGRYTLLSNGTVWPAEALVEVHGPPGEWVRVVMRCVAWGDKAVESSVLLVETGAFNVTVTSPAGVDSRGGSIGAGPGRPSVWALPSGVDARDRWPLTPAPVAVSHMWGSVVCHSSAWTDASARRLCRRTRRLQRA